MTSVELFVGAGGLGMGVTLAGFRTIVAIDWDHWACETIRRNRERGHPLVAHWNLWEGDVRDFDWSEVSEPVDLLAGGPPCQPFSLGGKHQAYLDPRDMFPATIEAVRRLRPRAFLLENVKGLTRSRFSDYLQYVILRLKYPDVQPDEGEGWDIHFCRLKRHHLSANDASYGGPSYDVYVSVLNAADYGVPQIRERLFIVGFRSDLKVRWSFPPPTHSIDALLYDKYCTGCYWDRHGVPKSARDVPPERYRARIRNLVNNVSLFRTLPWRTVRDALQGLPSPTTLDSVSWPNHVLQVGARQYPGHTGSLLDFPAKTVKAGDHGVPGGENMLVADDGKVRYFTVREAARIQTFPDGYCFVGSWSENMRQIGNAVPVFLARRVAASIACCLVEAEARSMCSKSCRMLA